jgi:hypothetical protein
MWQKENLIQKVTEDFKKIKNVTYFYTMRTEKYPRFHFVLFLAASSLKLHFVMHTSE